MYKSNNKKKDSGVSDGFLRAVVIFKINMYSKILDLSFIFHTFEKKYICKTSRQRTLQRIKHFSIK